MSYRVNHQKHITEYLQRYPTGTPKEIAAALPKVKRTVNSYGTIVQTIRLMRSQGKVRLVGHGTYASPSSSVSRIDVMSYRDECCYHILNLLERRGNSSLTPAEEIYETLLSKGFRQATVMRKLRQLKSLGILQKHGAKWHLASAAFEASEWRITSDGPTFIPQQEKVICAPSSKTPSPRGILGETVPESNRLRLHRSKREKAAVPHVPQVPQVPQHFSVPAPGGEPSIFD
jgi:hypothetical protein